MHAHGERMDTLTALQVRTAHHCDPHPVTEANSIGGYGPRIVTAATLGIHPVVVHNYIPTTLGNGMDFVLVDASKHRVFIYRQPATDLKLEVHYV